MRMRSGNAMRRPAKPRVLSTPSKRARAVLAHRADPPRVPRLADEGGQPGGLVAQRTVALVVGDDALGDGRERAHAGLADPSRQRLGRLDGRARVVDRRRPVADVREPMTEDVPHAVGGCLDGDLS